MVDMLLIQRLCVQYTIKMPKDQGIWVYFDF